MSVPIASQRKILIDGYNLRIPNGTGIATYGRNLSACLQGLGYGVDVLYGISGLPDNGLLREMRFFDTDPPIPPPVGPWRDIRRFFAASRQITAQPIELTGRVESRGSPWTMPCYDRLWNVPELFQKAGVYFDTARKPMPVTVPSRPDIAHWTYIFPLAITGARNITTIHDLVPLRLPYATLGKKPRFLSIARMMAKSADHVVTVSECSRRDIISLLGVPEDRVTNIYQPVRIAAEHAEKPPDVARREVEGIFDLTIGGYMLYFGAIEPKKNVGRLIEAYLASGIATPLVIVGKLAWKFEDELRLISDPRGPARDRIRRYDHLPRGLLVSLIRGAKAVLFPSLYEGFGLPVAEAMLLGTPVLTSTGGSLPEIAGDAAVLVDPYDVRAMADGIRALDSDAELRADLVAKGQRQVALFSDDACARRLSALYDRLLGARP